MDAVVLGAGFAGLAAARRLAAAGAETIVLEARDRVGGRVLNHDIGDGKVLEVGGQWVGPTQYRLLELARAVEVDTYPTWSQGANLFEVSGRTGRYTGTIPRISPAVLADFQQALTRLERMVERVPTAAPWHAPKAAQWDGITFATWLRRNVATRAARSLFVAAVEAVWAAQPEDVSLLHVLFYAHSAGSLQVLFDATGGAQDARFVGGSQLVALRVAGALGDRVHLSTPVRSLSWSADGVVVGDVRASRAVVTLPPALAGRLVYDPPLPGRRDQLTQRMPMGSVIKCMAIYDEPFWRKDGLSGQVASADGPVKVGFDNSPPDGAPGVLLGFLEGRQARDLGAASPEQRRRAVLGCFARWFGQRAASPRDYVERDWAQEEFSRGCYAGFLSPGGWTGLGDVLRPPIGPLHWAGAEYATVWNGYIDGAIRSGEEAADAVLASL